MQILFYFVITVHIIVCLFLVGVVLIQQGRSADLAGAFGGQGSQTAFGPRAAANVLTRLTTWSAIIFMCTSILLVVLYVRSTRFTLGAGWRQDRSGQRAGKVRQVSRQSLHHNKKAGRQACLHRFRSLFPDPCPSISDLCLHGRRRIHHRHAGRGREVKVLRRDRRVGLLIGEAEAGLSAVRLIHFDAGDLSPGGYGERELLYAVLPAPWAGR